MPPLLALVVLALLAQSDIGPKLTGEQRELNKQSFEKVWTTVRDRHWDPKLNGVDWASQRLLALPKLERARDMTEARAAIRGMLTALGQSHFALVPAELYRDINLGDDEPSSPRTPGAPDAPKREEECETGIGAGIVDGQAVVVSVRPGSPADKAGVKTGWIIDRIDGYAWRHSDAGELLEKERYLVGAIEGRLEGPLAEAVAVEFLDAAGVRSSHRLSRVRPEGRLARLGNMPLTRVAMEVSRLPGDVCHVRWNAFLDPEELMPKFEEAVRGCLKSKGFILDMRNNPGGIGAMAMGMAGWFFRRGGDKLGTLRSRRSTYDFEINPRPETFTGPLAVLVDGRSASTSEILAAGLQDLGRATVFGTPTAGAALPSEFMKLPNGDGFQYVVADYISRNGKRLEGGGVTPDKVVRHTRASLLAGRDAVVDVAVEWILQGGVK